MRLHVVNIFPSFSEMETRNYISFHFISFQTIASAITRFAGKKRSEKRLKTRLKRFKIVRNESDKKPNKGSSNTESGRRRSDEKPRKGYSRNSREPRS